MASGLDLDHYESNIEAIAESFTCFVCIKLAENPHNCVHCGKMACFTCFQECLKTNRLCPHCRKDLEIQQLKHFGWYTDVIDNLKALQSSEKCSIHSKILNLYCSDCRKSICYKCVILGEKHYHHELNSLRDVYRQHVKDIEQHLARLRAKMQSLRARMAFRKIQGNASKIKCNEEAHAYAEDVIKRCNKKFDEELERFTSQESTLDIAGIENILQKSQEQLKNSSESTLICSSSSIFNDLQEAKNKLENFVLPKSMTIPNEIRPVWHCKEFNVTNCTQILTTRKRVYSQALEVDGWSWKMAVYPNTSDFSEGEDSLGVAVRLYDGALPKVRAEVEVRVEMYHCTSLENNVVETRIYTFGPDTEEFNIDNFYRIASLSSGGFVNSGTDSIKFTFSIRSPTFFEECKKQKLIIAQLLKKQKAKDQKIEELENKQKALVS